jgi:membrane associated rhomboid family serine protease/antitoxin component YwqK of YwqJK toxin-antitoxin module
MTNRAISTYILIAINVLVYAWLALEQQSLMMDSNADALAILHTGANLNPLTLGGEPWRMITSMFLHYGLIHLAVNMYALFVLGTSLEPAVGTPRFLMIYFFCGIAAGIASLVFNIFTPSAGASGALFGLFGYQLGAEVISNFQDRHKLLGIFLNFLVFVIINTAIASGVNVDVAGHVGGFFGGVILATFHFKLRWFIRKEFLALLLVMLSATLLVLPRDQVEYYRIFKQVVDLDDHTSNLYKTATTDDALKDSLVATLPRWDSITSSIRNLRKIPAGVEVDTAILKDYAMLRKRGTFYRTRLIERESYIYYDSIEILDGEFKALPPLQYILNYKISEKEQPIDTVSNQITLEPAKVYYDSHWRETDDILLANYYRIGNKDSLGRWHGVVGDYYKNGRIQMKGKYLRDMKDGIFIYYSERNTYQSAGRYSQERSIGKWENFHWNGALESEVYYGDETFTANVFDSLGNPQVINGNGKSQQWYANGQLREEGEYRNGKKEGLWFGFRSDGKPYYKEEYRDNRLIHGVSQGKDGRRYVYDHLSEYPFPVDGMPAFKKYIDANMRVLAGSKHGKVKLVFSIGVDGSTWNPVVIQSVSPEHDQEAIRLLNDGPLWRTSLLHGQEKVPSQGYIEIDF